MAVAPLRVGVLRLQGLLREQGHSGTCWLVDGIC